LFGERAGGVSLKFGTAKIGSYLNLLQGKKRQSATFVIVRKAKLAGQWYGSQHCLFAFTLSLKRIINRQMTSFVFGYYIRGFLGPTNSSSQDPPSGRTTFSSETYIETHFTDRRVDFIALEKAQAESNYR
jgi:hypothetical protein